MEYSDRRQRSGRRPAEPAVQTQPDAEECDATEWDEVVDVICVGSGAVGLAAAVVVNSFDLSSELVAVPPNNSASLAARLGVRDPQTIQYLESVTDDIPVPGPVVGVGTGALPIRVVEGPVETEDVRGTVLPTFSGAALQTWAGKCLAAPGGMLSTTVANPSLTVTYRESGRAIEALLVGAVDLDSLDAVDFDDWITRWADEHDIGPGDSHELQRLVFDSGVVVGAVLGTASGSRTIRARHGVVLAIGADGQHCSWPTEGLDGVSTAELAFITRAASRFGRLELLVTAPSAAE